MRIFVTGATGFIGGRVAAQLRDAGHEVVALVRAPERAKVLVALGVMLAAGDVIDRDSICAVMRGCDATFHVTR